MMGFDVTQPGEKMRTRTIAAILVAVAIAIAIGYTTAAFMSGGGSDGESHTVPNGQTMTGGMSMGGT